MISFLNEKSISISILNVEDIRSFLDNLNKIKKRYNLSNIVIHFDVMDKDFTLGEGINLEHIKTVKEYGFFADVHLMCSNPKKYIDEAVKLGADNITIHYEIENFYENLKYLNKKKGEGLSIGISVKPNTNIEKIVNYKDMYDLILVMTVEPGKGGQTYIENINGKIKIALTLGKTVQIDGGVNDETINIPNELGVKSFVIGSYITSNLNKIESRLIKVLGIINK